jgi:hypothetical protein
MTWGLSQANLLHPWLSSMRGGGVGTTFTAPATLFDQLHTGDPGASGTANVSSTTARQSVVWGAPASNSMAQSTTPSWTSWAGTNGESVAGVSTWSASSAGTFYHSTQFTLAKTVNTGDTISVATHTFALAPAAA